jgi:DNA polymerase I
LECLYQKLDAYLVLTAYDQLVIEVKEEQVDYAAKILERAMIEAGQDLLDPVPVVVDLKIGKYWS